MKKINMPSSPIKMKISILMKMTTSLMIVTMITTMTGHQANALDVRLGMMSPFRHIRLGWETNAAAATMAVDRAKREGLLNDINVTVLWEDDGCSSKGGAAGAVVLHLNYSVDAFIGPPCSSSTTPAGLLASVWNLPMFTPASSDPSLEDKTTYNTLVRLGPPFNRMGSAFVEIFRYFGWKRAVMVSRRKTDNRNVFCDYSSRAAEETFRENNITLAESIIIGDNPSDDEIDEILYNLRQRGRIIILCTEMANARRRILLRAHAASMFDGSYVFFLPDHLPAPNVQMPWVSGAPDDDVIKEAYRHTFQITVAEMAGPEVENFRDEIPLRMAEPPWNYNGTLISGRRGSEYSPFLHDVVYLYLLVLNETVDEGGSHRDGRLLFAKATGRTFRGVTGNVKLDSNGDRLPDYWVWRMVGEENTFSLAMEARITNEGPKKIFLMRNFTWATPDGRPPPDIPPCGFFQEKCPPDQTDRMIAIAVSVMVCIVLGVLGAGLYVYCRRVQLEQELEQMLWKVDYGEIKFTKSNVLGSISQMSLHSFGSAPSGVRSRSSGSAFGEGQIFSAVGIYRGQIVAIRRISRTKLTIGRAEQLHLKVLKEMSHENLVTFVGLCVDERFPCILTNYCTKGSLQDIIENDDIKLDWTFKSSLIMDLVNGMNYLHGSPLRHHGSLKSSNCLVDNRWVLKVADFGVQGFCKFYENKQTDYQLYRGLFWTAPEVLRSDTGLTAMSEQEMQKADVYSFGIILYELLSRSFPYDTDTMTPREIIQRVKAGEDPPFRPISTRARGDRKGAWPNDVPDTAVKLMAACWSECTFERPSFPGVKSIFAALNKGKKLGIVDNMLMMLERYANNLEEIVEQRTLELVEERKKSDMLLYRMLPRVVAEKLKAGNVVPPEMYEAVTIYFSDIVGFTTLASASAPMQIVDLLNDLYSNFDSIIAKHDVYKVETIGDAYMVVSGLPESNGDRHVTEIANMALDLLSSVTYFRIRHKPDTQLCLRIGLHSGPCAAGVVGLTMPRYCLFGDTVNMASRMESTGQPLRIQVSQQTKDLLDELGGYHLSYRGTVEVKGKGQQNTYWLEGREGLTNVLPCATDA